MRGIPVGRAFGAAMLAASASAAWAYELHNGTVVGGGAQLRSGAWTLVVTLGEPVMARSEQDGVVLVSGFPATLASTAPAGARLLFRDGFEGDGLEPATNGEPTP
jgi:hypothetical protein